jgi:hypothetical protein
MVCVSNRTELRRMLKAACEQRTLATGRVAVHGITLSQYPAPW